MWVLHWFNRKNGNSIGLYSVIHWFNKRCLMVSNISGFNENVTSSHFRSHIHRFNKKHRDSWRPIFQDLIKKYPQDLHKTSTKIFYDLIKLIFIFGSWKNYYWPGHHQKTILYNEIISAEKPILFFPGYWNNN